MAASLHTDGSSRAVHEQQHGETQRLVENARTNNNLRLIEVLERDGQSLPRILEGLDAIGQRQRGEIARLREELALAHGGARELELDRRARRA